MSQALTEPLGVHASATHPLQQSACYSELVNKLAWVIGSYYQTRYSNTRSPARIYARKVASAITKSQGYPLKISK